MSLWKRPACKTLLKALGISSTTVWIAADILKALPILSDTTAKSYTVDWEDLKAYLKSEEAIFLERSNMPIIYKFFKDFINHRKKTKKVFLVVDLSPTFLNTETSEKIFWQFGKQDYFRHIMKSWANMPESSDSLFFRITIGVQPGPDAFDESKLVMTFLTHLGVTDILCSFSLVLEGKAGKEMPALSRLECLEKFSANRCSRQHLRTIKQRRYSWFTFVKNTISSLPKVVRAKFLRSNILF